MKLQAPSGNYDRLMTDQPGKGRTYGLIGKFHFQLIPFYVATHISLFTLKSCSTVFIFYLSPTLLQELRLLLTDGRTEKVNYAGPLYT